MWQSGRERASGIWRRWNPDKPKPLLPQASGVYYSHLSDEFENLVLKGGGAKGIAYIGACKVLDDAGILKNIKRFAGTSAGAITASLLAIGMSPQEMLEELSQKNLMDLMDPPVKYGWSNLMNWLPHIPGVPSWLTVDRMSMAIAAITERGVCEGEDFLNWFGDVLDRHLERLHPEEYKKGLNKDITFDKLHHMLGKELCIVAYNMVLDSETYFHVKTTPMVKIREAVRMSMSIPGLFKPYDGFQFPEFTFIDGGLAANYPIWAYDGWYLSMEEKNTFQNKLAPLEDDVEKGKKIRKMFHPENRRKDRFGTRNDKTLGILMFSSKDREMYQEEFETRLEKIAKDNPNFIKEPPSTEMYKKYREERNKSEEARYSAQTVLGKLVGRHIKGLIEYFEGKRDELPPVPGAPEPATLDRELFRDENIKALNATTKEEAFKMLMLDDDGKLTTAMLNKIYKNAGPLQLAKRKYLGNRLVSDPLQFYGAMLEFVGNDSGIEEDDIPRSIAIDVDYVGTLDFHMAPEDMEFLVEQGAVATIAFLEERKNE
ncbi:Hypp7652 [Branchiostoma lanceolatum]|uniref:Hypp7652 protein n=1 Tax=Branchiostoma lanceolatum TaxID=7740 RepID=A0A8K0ECL7_BRALA|nr:Hypp7652 [Branchiostoma lanceolatum]